VWHCKRRRRIDDFHKLLGTPPTPGTNTILITHKPNIVDALGKDWFKLGINVGQTTVAKHMATKRRPPSQGLKTFLRNHADGIVAMDMFVVRQCRFGRAFDPPACAPGAVVAGVTAHPIAQWVAKQLTEALGWKDPPAIPRFCLWGAFIRRVGAMGIRDQPVSHCHGRTDT
jgi:hypothetical protein